MVLGLAILPFLGVGGMQLYKAEVPGPVVDKLKPRLKDTAMILWKVYLFLTVLETILLLTRWYEFARLTLPHFWDPGNRRLFHQERCP